MCPALLFKEAKLGIISNWKLNEFEDTSEPTNRCKKIDYAHLLAHGGPDFLVKKGAGRLLNDLLVAALDGALPLIQVDGVSVLVPQHLSHQTWETPVISDFGKQITVMDYYYDHDYYIIIFNDCDHDYNN